LQLTIKGQARTRVGSPLEIGESLVCNTSISIKGPDKSIGFAGQHRESKFGLILKIYSTGYCERTTGFYTFGGAANGFVYFLDQKTA
jgi:hypothetical protein